MMPGLIRKLNMMLKRSNQPALALFRNRFDAELLDASGLTVARAQAALDLGCRRHAAILRAASSKIEEMARGAQITGDWANNTSAPRTIPAFGGSGALRAVPEEEIRRIVEAAREPGLNLIERRQTQQRRFAMKVKDAMHKGVDWVSPDIPVTELAKLMREHDIGAIPIGEN